MRGPGVLLLQRDDSLGRGIERAGSVLSEALQQKYQQDRQRNTLTALQEALENNDFNSLSNRTDIDPSLLIQNLPTYLKTAQEQQVLNSLGFGSNVQPMNNTSLPNANNIANQNQYNGAQTPIRPPSNLLNMTTDQLTALKAINNPVIRGAVEGEIQRRKFEIDQNKEATRLFESDRDFKYKRNLPFLQEIDDNRKSLQSKEMALNSMEDAIRTGNTGFWTRDNFANMLGRFGESLRTAKGAQLLNAQKEFLLGNISRAGSRPNQWIEQQIMTMLTHPGRSEEANLAVVESLRSQVELEKLREQLTDKIEAETIARTGRPDTTEGLASKVSEAMKPYADKIQGKLSYRLREVYEKELGDQLYYDIGKKVSSGTPLTRRAAGYLVYKTKGNLPKALDLARKLGYTIPTKEEALEYEIQDNGTDVEFEE